MVTLDGVAWLMDRGAVGVDDGGGGRCTGTLLSYNHSHKPLHRIVDRQCRPRGLLGGCLLGGCRHGCTAPCKCSATSGIDYLQLHAPPVLHEALVRIQPRTYASRLPAAVAPASHAWKIPPESR